MAKLQLGASAEILENETFIATDFCVNENGGGVGGSSYHFYAKGNPEEYVSLADRNGMVGAIGIDGCEKYINLSWCSELTKVNILRVAVTQTEWNKKYGSECKHFQTGKKINVYINLGIETKFEVTRNTSAVTLGVEGCHIIHESKAE